MLLLSFIFFFNVFIDIGSVVFEDWVVKFWIKILV